MRKQRKLQRKEYIIVVYLIIGKDTLVTFDNRIGMRVLFRKREGMRNPYIFCFYNKLVTFFLRVNIKLRERRNPLMKKR